jgi:L-arabinonolactonase
MHAELVLDCKNKHGEGIFWNAKDQRVWWTDIEGKQLFSFEPKAQTATSYQMKDRVCCFAPTSSGDLIVAFANEIVLLDLQTGTEEKICDFEPENSETRLNDGRTDRQGRLIVGGMNEVSGRANSSVISIDADLNITTLISNISCANSTCFSPDGATMYFADTPDREVLAFDYETSTGTVANKRLLTSFEQEPGLPDGSCVDAEGGVWNAQWEGGRVVRIAPTGEIDRIINVPVNKPTCCAFGGENLDTLFITTSRLMSSAEDLEREPQSGGLYAVKPGIGGVQDIEFKLNY